LATHYFDAPSYLIVLKENLASIKKKPRRIHVRKAFFIDSLHSSIEGNVMPAKNLKETRVYKLAFELAMEIFEVTKGFPKEEKYSLIDQIRKSSRSVCICLIEACRKKRYVAHFVLKATESDSFYQETST
jgi:23S rRNA-intervening sequence protein